MGIDAPRIRLDEQLGSDRRVIGMGSAGNQGLVRKLFQLNGANVSVHLVRIMLRVGREKVPVR